MEEVYKTYQIMELNEEPLPYRLRYRFLVLKFCGADSKQKPIYNIVKKCSSYDKAKEYVGKQIGLL